MKVYFSANHRNLERDLPLYRAIIDAIHSEGHTLVNGWVETANNKWSPEFKSDDWVSVCIQARCGVEDADVVLAEASGETGFGVGFEVACALSKGKKVYILIQKSEINNSYAYGLDRHEVKVEEYEPQKVRAVVRRILGEVK